VQTSITTAGRDLKTWTRLEMFYKVISQNPGSDVIAALAAASIVFRDSDAAYSTKLLQTAAKVIEFDSHS